MPLLQQSSNLRLLVCVGFLATACDPDSSSADPEPTGAPKADGVDEAESVAPRASMCPGEVFDDLSICMSFRGAGLQNFPKGAPLETQLGWWLADDGMRSCFDDPGSEEGLGSAEQIANVFCRGEDDDVSLACEDPDLLVASCRVEHARRFAANFEELDEACTDLCRAEVLGEHLEQWVADGKAIPQSEVCRPWDFGLFQQLRLQGSLRVRVHLL